MLNALRLTHGLRTWPGIPWKCWPSLPTMSAPVPRRCAYLPGLAGCRRRAAVILRFLRHLPPQMPPVIRHWTVVNRPDQDDLHLFDCSHEHEDILHIPARGFVTAPTHICPDRLLCILPSSLHLVRRA